MCYLRQKLFYTISKSTYTDAIKQNISQMYFNENSYEETMQYLKEFSRYGIYVFRYSYYKKLHVMDLDPVNNWPESIPLFIDPQEPSITLDRRLLLAEEAMTYAMHEQEIERKKSIQKHRRQQNH